MFVLTDKPAWQNRTVGRTLTRVLSLSDTLELHVYRHADSYVGHLYDGDALVMSAVRKDLSGVEAELWRGVCRYLAAQPLQMFDDVPWAAVGA